MKKILLSVLCFSIFSTLTFSQPPPPPSNYPYSEDFESFQGFGSTITGWTGSTITLQAYLNHGTNGSKGMAREVFHNNNSSSPANISIECPTISTLPQASVATSELSFNYRIVDAALYPSTPGSFPTDASIVISVNVGGTYTTLHTIDFTNHTASTSFSQVILPLTNFQGNDVSIKFEINRGTNCDYWVDIDDVMIADAGTVGLIGINNSVENIFFNNNKIFVNQENFNEGNINLMEVYSLDGKKVASFIVDKKNYVSPSLNIGTGLFMFTVTGNNKRLSKKVILN